MAEYKKNHIIPISLLENFKSPDNKFYFYDKNKPEDGVEHRNTKNTFYLNNEFVFVDESGNRDHHFESKYLKDIDDAAAIPIKKLNTPSANGIHLTKSDLDAIAWLIASFLVRVPEALMMMFHPDSKEDRAYASKMYQTKENIPFRPPDFLKRNIEERKEFGYLKPVYLQKAKSEIERKYRLIRNCQPELIRCSNGLGFIITDKCVFDTSFFDDFEFERKKNDVRAAMSFGQFIPINQWIAFGFREKASDSPAIGLSNEQTHRINCQLFHYARQVGCGNKHYLEELIANIP